MLIYWLRNIKSNITITIKQGTIIINRRPILYNIINENLKATE